jgi:hypothetical protein
MTQPFVVEEVTYNEKIFRIIQDAYIIGGSKSRGLGIFIQKYFSYAEFVYAGPAIGYAQYALAHTCKENNKKATIFLSTHLDKDTLPTKQAKRCGANIIKIKNSLAETQNDAKKYCESKPDERFLCPFGLDTDEFINIMVKQFKLANPPDIGNARLWVTVGSGTILKVLQKIYPQTHFMCVIVGKKIWEDQFSPEDWQRMTIYISALKFEWDVRKPDIPPYRSVSNYDAKLWHFARNHGMTGDYIFNIAG